MIGKIKPENKNDKDLRSKMFLTFEHWHMEISPWLHR